MMNLNKSERLVILILVAALISGLGISAYKRSRLSPVVRTESLDMDISGAGTAGDSSSIGKEKININEAGPAELMKLEGVGETLARRIIDYRDSNGPFASIEEINKVKGIGKKLFEKMREDITVE